jgi:hypothetical protein
MLLSELQEYVIVESGEYIFADVGKIQMNLNNFWKLVQRALGFYQKHNPITKLQFVTTSTVPFIYDINGVYSDYPPAWISRLVIAQLAVNVLSFYYGKPQLGPLPVIWRYENPALYISISGNFSVTSHYNYTTTVTTDNQGNIEDVNIQNIDLSHYRFMELVKWYFLRSVSRARSAFILNESAISMDAEKIYSEASAEIKNVEDDIRLSGKWYESIGT